MRIVSDLQWAKALDGWPDSIPKSRSRGIKALGRRYEGAVAHQLGAGATRGQWWRFRDANGPGLCQTDFILEGARWVVILEAKHTWTPGGMDQLHYLYIPVVGMATGKQVVGVQVCKHLVPYHTGSVFTDLESAIASAKETWRVKAITRCVTLHWRGVGPIIHSNLNWKEVA